MDPEHMSKNRQYQLFPAHMLSRGVCVSRKKEETSEKSTLETFSSSNEFFFWLKVRQQCWSLHTRIPTFEILVLPIMPCFYGSYVQYSRFVWKPNKMRVNSLNSVRRIPQAFKALISTSDENGRPVFYICGIRYIWQSFIGFLFNDFLKRSETEGG